MEKMYKVRIENVDEFSPKLLGDLIKEYLNSMTNLEYRVSVECETDNKKDAADRCPLCHGTGKRLAYHV